MSMCLGDSVVMYCRVLFTLPSRCPFSPHSFFFLLVLSLRCLAPSLGQGGKGYFVHEASACIDLPQHCLSFALVTVLSLSLVKTRR